MSMAEYGIGAYSIPEAGSLIGLAPNTLRHWLFGYRYHHHGPTTIQAPVWNPQYGCEQEEPILGFRDLMEARVVRGLRSLKIGLPTIRQCLKRASEIIEDDHPLSTKRFRTDGRRIFLQMTEGLNEPRLIDLKARQHAFSSVIEPSFVDLEFETEVAARWWLLPKKRTILIDPKRSFGVPIVHENGVPTGRIAQVVAAEGSVERTARLFELKPNIVRDVLLFEGRKTLKHAA